jgi:hypothetical protein
MPRTAATVFAASVVLLAAHFAAAQGVAPNATTNAAGDTQQLQFTGTVKEYNNQDRVVLMDNGDKFYLRANQPATGLDELRPGNRVTVTYFVDPGEQNEKFIRGIIPAAEGGPVAR